MKPFLKWVGGKSKLLDTILSSFPKDITNYHEPFVGGGSVLLALLSHPSIHVSGKVYAYDVNPTLIGLYKNLQTRPEELIHEMERLVREFSECKGTDVNRTVTVREEATSPESYYFYIRTMFNALVDRESIQASAMFLFMNKTCFRGVYREGPHGFNVPYGNYKNPSVFEPSHLRNVSHLLQRVEFRTCSFQESLACVQPGDVVYLDPPYAPETKNSFVSYTAAGFSEVQHAQLFALCHEMTTKNVLWRMSNADVEKVRNAFPGHHILTLDCRRAIHSTQPNTRTNEVLISNSVG